VANAATAPAVEEAQVWMALEYVIDPELSIDIVNLGLVYAVSVEGSQVDLLMTLTSMGCPMQQEIAEMVASTVGSLPGVEKIRLTWTFDPPWTEARLTEEGRDLMMTLGYL
jgi:metal-sulfur cluster biosynthetic enzyme